jgi:hypothetical protein
MPLEMPQNFHLLNNRFNGFKLGDGEAFSTACDKESLSFASDSFFLHVGQRSLVPSQLNSLLHTPQVCCFILPSMVFWWSVRSGVKYSVKKLKDEHKKPPRWP